MVGPGGLNHQPRPCAGCGLQDRTHRVNVGWLIRAVPMREGWFYRSPGGGRPVASHLGISSFSVLRSISPDCVVDASLVPGTCLERCLDLKGLINKFLESVFWKWESSKCQRTWAPIPKCRANQGTEQAWIWPAAKHAIPACGPKTPATLEHCPSSLAWPLLRFEDD